jgi:hypothetical protein
VQFYYKKQRKTSEINVSMKINEFLTDLQIYKLRK